MFDFYLKKGLKMWIMATGLLLSSFAWAQTVKVSPVAVPTGNIAVGTELNTIYGFKVEVGLESDVRLQNLTVNFAGTFPDNVANIELYAYENLNTPLDPDYNYWARRNFDYLSTTGGVNILNNWNRNLSAGETYYFFIQSNFYDQGTVTGVGSSISASVPSLASVEFTATNPVTVTGSFGAGASYNVVSGAPIITPFDIPGKQIAVGNYPHPILGYKVECPNNMLSNVIQSNIVVSISGTYDYNLDDIAYQFYYGTSPVFDNKNMDTYSDSYTVSNNTEAELSIQTYERQIYKGEPIYVFLTARPQAGTNGSTIKAVLDPSKVKPSSAGSVISGNTFTLINAVPTVTIPSTLNVDAEFGGPYRFTKLYTFGITAPANSDLVFSSLTLSVSGVDLPLNSFGNGDFYRTKGSATPMTESDSYKLQSISYDFSTYYNFVTSDTTGEYTFNAGGADVIPAGQTLYYTIVARSYANNEKMKLKVLGIAKVNGTTFAGTSMEGGVIVRKSKATFRTVGFGTNNNISQFSENIIYAFNGKTNAVYYWTAINKLVVTLTGSLDYNNIKSVRLYGVSNDQNYSGLLRDASNFATVNDPTSNVIEFIEGEGGYMNYYLEKESQFFITVELKGSANASVVGQNIGVAKILTSDIGLRNYWTNVNIISIIGTDLTDGPTLTYVAPSPLTITSNAISSTTLGTNSRYYQSIYSLKFSSSNGFPISNVVFTTTGTYTSDDISEFYLYGSDQSVFDENIADYLTSVEALSTGTGEVLSFSIDQTAPAGVNYLFLVPNVSSSSSIGKTVKVSAVPLSAISLGSEAIAKSGSTIGGNTYTITQTLVTLTGMPVGGGLMPKDGYVRTYTIEVNANNAFKLEGFSFNTNGNYKNNGLNYINVYTSKQLLTNYNDDFDYINSYGISSEQSNLGSGEVVDLNGSSMWLPAGKSYITIFFQSGYNSNQSFGVAGINTELTTITGGTITYINNIASTPNTILGQILTMSTIPLASSTVYRADNQVIYAAKYRSNVSDYFEYFGTYLLGSFTEADFKDAPLKSLKVWISNSSTFNSSTATKISGEEDGASDLYYDPTYYEFYNNGLRLNQNTDYYIYVTVDVSPTATPGHSFAVYGEDPGDYDDNFYFEPDGDYEFDATNTNMLRGSEMVILQSTSTTEALNPAEVVLYPNPSTGVVNITGDFDSATVYDLIGAPVLSSTTSTLDLSGVNDGLYFVKITKAGASSIKKIVVKK